jgi:ribonuclease Z
MGLVILGESVSGVGTCLTIPELGVVLDCGVVTNESLRYQSLLITHGHVDHTHGIIRHAQLRMLSGRSPTQVYCPETLVAALVELKVAWEKIQGGRKINVTIIGVGLDEVVTLPNGVMFSPFRTHHVVPSQGYMFSAVRKKLKSALSGVPQETIRSMVLNGQEVTDKQVIPVLAYTGDSRATVLDENEYLYDVETLITECTYLDASKEQSASRWGHTNINDLSSRAGKFNNKRVILTHFSAAYSDQDITKAVNELPESLRAKVSTIPAT